MNADRRNQLSDAIDLMERAKDLLGCVLDGEQEAYDNLPVSLQESERGEGMEENVDNLGDIVESVESVIDDVQAVMGD